MQNIRYENPEMEIVTFEETDDVITMSTGDQGSGGSTGWNDV